MKRRILFAMMVMAITVTAVVGTAFAAAAYHGTWPEQPYWGNHWWYNNDPTGSFLTWYADDQWTFSTASSMQYWHTHLPWNEYRIEQEAYNPGAGTSCDRLSRSQDILLQIFIQGPVKSLENKHSRDQCFTFCQRTFYSLLSYL